jgi:hypothetical protein
LSGGCRLENEPARFHSPIRQEAEKLIPHDPREIRAHPRDSRVNFTSVSVAHRADGAAP